MTPISITGGSNNDTHEQIWELFMILGKCVKCYF
jgi:hypothetical protein